MEGGSTALDKPSQLVMDAIPGKRVCDQGSILFSFLPFLPPFLPPSLPSLPPSLPSSLPSSLPPSLAPLSLSSLPPSYHFFSYPSLPLSFFFLSPCSTCTSTGFAICTLRACPRELIQNVLICKCFVLYHTKPYSQPCFQVFGHPMCIFSI